MAANATFALNAAVWFRRARLLIVSPDSSGTGCPLSGRNSTYRPVQNSGASSRHFEKLNDKFGSKTWLAPRRGRQSVVSPVIARTSSPGANLLVVAPTDIRAATRTVPL